MHKVTILGEGSAEFRVGDGASRAAVVVGSQSDREMVRIINHRGDLTIEIPAFEVYEGFVITVLADHTIRVEELLPLPALES